MQLCKVRLGSGEVQPALLIDGQVRPFRQEGTLGLRTLSDVLHAEDPRALAQGMVDEWAHPLTAAEVEFLPPLDQQEVWAAGVTYKRSKEERERESAGAARFYDLVYSAARPELFFKAPAYRVRGPGETVRIRRDSKWNVPEPELALVVSPRLTLVGFTIGNDMSSRDIEGENPLYLPQAKCYDHSCAVGPAITLASDFPPPEQAAIRLIIERGGQTAFDGQTTVAAIKRSFEELISWLGRETTFPNGAILLTGTGVVPPDDFSLLPADVVHIDISGIGRLTNTVEQLGG